MLEHVHSGTLSDWFKTFNIKGRNLSYLNPLGLGEVPSNLLVNYIMSLCSKYSQNVVPKRLNLILDNVRDFYKGKTGEDLQEDECIEERINKVKGLNDFIIKLSRLSLEDLKDFTKTKDPNLLSNRRFFIPIDKVLI